ncbi:MAG TPA: hypothetical protein VHF88_07810 [Thermoleophilaceae bacterium]|nr:hypothetical protein [Thermoleophilaceae bacterium]
MSLTDRDRKIMLVLVPVLILAPFWFLLLSPKREQAATAGQELAAQEQRRDDARIRAASLTTARTSFAADYAELVRIGKAVPTAVDMPTVLVQLEQAARGTDIEFTRITAAEREAAVVPAATDDADPVDPGGEPAQSGPGAAGEAAGETAAAADQSAAAAEQPGLDETDTQTSQPANDGALPVGGGTAPTSSASATGTAVPGLDTVGLELEFTGNFLDLSEFFHRIKRYVELDGEKLAVRGRLLTVDGVEFSSEPDIFPKIRATVTATAYLAPAVEGATAGATPGGPGPVSASTGASAPPLAASTPMTGP